MSFLTEYDVIFVSVFSYLSLVFIFMWTPVLKSFVVDPDPEKGELPYGIIFSTFMVSCMAGSSLFSILVQRLPVEKLGVGIFVAGAIAMLLVALRISETVSFIALNLFEVCVGLYFPTMGTMKGSIVPENKRVAIYNLFRIPLNLIVVVSLLADPTPSMAFGMNFVMISLAGLLQGILAIRRHEKNEASDRSFSKDLELETAMLLVQDGSIDE